MMKLIKAIAFTTGVFLLSNQAAQANGLLVGYVDYTHTGQPSMQTAISHGYNMIVVSFASVTANGDASLSPVLSSYDLQHQINQAHANGTKVLVSVGGEDNTFNPGTSVSSQTVAQSIYANLIKPYGFDGIDFDLESISWSAQQVKNLINNLKQIDPDIIISGAPQASMWVKPGVGTTITFAPALWAGSNGLVESSLFNYIFLQAYNQYGGMQVYQGDKEYMDNTPGILTAVYDLYQQNIHWGTTQLIVGEPSSSDAGHGLTPQQTAADITCLKTGKSCQYTPSQLYPNTPGVMTWSIGHDADHGWAFANAVKEVL